MAQTRLRNPLHNLVQTAFDLALYLRHVSLDEFIDVMTEVRNKYAAPKESWLWFMFYSRYRLGQLDQAIHEMKSESSESLDDDDTGKMILNAVTTILKEGGWEDTSANTNLLRALLKQIHGYDPGAALTIDEIYELKDLLFVAIEQRIAAEERLSQEEQRLKEIDEQKIKLEKEVLRKQEELLRKQEEIYDNESRLKLLEVEQSKKDAALKLIELERELRMMELKDYEEQLEQIEHERHKREEELETARQTLLLLNPDIDIRKMGFNEIESVMSEAKLVAQAAVKTYLHERNEILRQKQERENLRGKMSSAKKSLSGKNLGGIAVSSTDKIDSEELQKLDAEKLERQAEVKKLCQSRQKGNDQGVKALLERLFKMKKDESSRMEAQREADEKRVVQERGSLARLYSEGVRTQIINPGALAAISAAVDSSEQTASAVPLQRLKLATPKSSNAEFLAAFEHVKASLKPRTSQNVTVRKQARPLAAAETAREQVEVPQQSASPRMTYSPDGIPVPPPPPKISRDGRFFSANHASVPQASPSLPPVTRGLQSDLESMELVDGLRV